jgi:hypothetical protein
MTAGRLSTPAEVGDIIADVAAEVRRTRAPRSSVGYVIALLGAALFVTSCFLPYYGFAGGRSVTLYDQLLVAQGGGSELGVILFLFGGVATVVVVTILGLTRGERSSLRAFLAARSQRGHSPGSARCSGWPAYAKARRSPEGSHWRLASGCRP